MSSSSATAPLHVRKRSGRIVDFRKQKITQAVKLCLVNGCGWSDVGDINLAADNITDEVFRALGEVTGSVHVDRIQDLVTAALRRNQMPDAAERFSEYCREHARLRDDASRGIKRFFTKDDQDPFSLFEYERYECVIRHHETGKEIFRGTGEVPRHWSTTARDILISKYFRKAGVPDRTIISPVATTAPEWLKPRVATVDATRGAETSIRQVVHRIVGHWTYSGYVNGYFDAVPEELVLFPGTPAEAKERNAKSFYAENVFIMLQQFAAPNSPQWFNTGLSWAYGITGQPAGQWYADLPNDNTRAYSNTLPVAEHNQKLESSIKRTTDAYTRVAGHACFILSVADELFNGSDGITDWITTEARIFRFGAGSGINISNLRGRGERLSGGGVSSGVMSFARVADVNGGTIKSGGITRRAARMVVMDADHPDISEFITCKAKSENMVASMICGSQVVADYCQKIMLAVPANVGFNDAMAAPALRHLIRDALDAHVPYRYIEKAVRMAVDGDRTWTESIYDSAYEGTAYTMAPYQNANHSVRIPSDFYTKVDADAAWQRNWRLGGVAHTGPARELETEMAEACWHSGDPGAQFSTTINEWNVTPNDGEIKASNPCQPAHATLLTPHGIKTLGSVEVGDEIWTGSKWAAIKRKVYTGIKPVFKFRTAAGFFLGTACHKVFQGGKRVEAGDAVEIDICRGPSLKAIKLDKQAMVDGWVLGASDIELSNGVICLRRSGSDAEKSALEHFSTFLTSPNAAGGSYAWKVETTITADELPLTYTRSVPSRFKFGGRDRVASFLRGLYAAKGFVTVYGNQIVLEFESFQMISDVQEMLGVLGVASFYTTNIEKPVALSTNGALLRGESYNLNVTKDRNVFMNLIGLIAIGKTQQVVSDGLSTEQQKTSYEVRSRQALGDLPVWDIEVDAEEHSYWTGGLLVSNCAEHMRLNNSGCNLASTRLSLYRREDGSIDVDALLHVTSLWTTILDITVSMAALPEKAVAIGVYNYRDIGLGFADLGSLLMSMGFAYDSDEGRTVAGMMTALMQGQAHLTSAQLAKRLGPYPRFEANKAQHLRCVKNHMAALGVEEFTGLTNKPPVIDLAVLRRALPGDTADAVHKLATALFAESYALAEKHGYRNAEITVVAPTGTIGFVMDCDTTGVEPMFAILAYKILAGGGKMIVEPAACVRAGLLSLGYNRPEVETVLAEVRSHIDKMTADGKKVNEADIQDILRRSIKPEHRPVFDTAVGKYSIAWPAHIKMMASVQSFISGAISKSVNLPASASVEDMRQAFRMSHDLGVKAVAIYRDGSKLSQPLNVGKGDIILVRHSPHLDTAKRMKLGYKRVPGIDIVVGFGDGHLYVRTSCYDDGSVGEIWATYTADQGLVQALLSHICKTANLALQFGVPLNEIITSWSNSVFEPKGAVSGHPHIKWATSITNLLGRLLSFHCLGDNSVVQVKPEGVAELDYQDQVMNLTGDSCPHCGSLLYVPSGANCKRCKNCGHAGGCG